MESRKIVYRETGVVALGQLICLLLMLGVFALLGYFDKTVLLGGLLGAVLATGNFFFMAVSATLASDKAVNQDVKGGTALMKASYFLRLGVIFILLFAGVKSGLCNALASVIPLALTRIIITVSEFFRKSKEEKV
ncbi:MAG: hypothetical protein E7326_04675 [Clostridiales bacterium]|nr:hypothetical protein [Clostridiales bacterium]